MGQSAQSSAAEVSVGPGWPVGVAILCLASPSSLPSSPSLVCACQIAALLEVRADLEGSLRSTTQQLQHNVAAHDGTRHLLEQVHSQLSATQDQLHAAQQQAADRERDLLQQVHSATDQLDAHMNQCVRFATHSNSPLVHFGEPQMTCVRETST